ncbi:hypothetical protein [Pandoravirus japonicus]|uniref:Uncharacterized protein n=1 Tax=Pandoravirus japonicus TaxID=2823154 RepID=A0A811BSD2_9VIRU|nr:hypothetical protein [Pandoravirus japonicus]
MSLGPILCATASSARKEKKGHTGSPHPGADVIIWQRRQPFFSPLVHFLPGCGCRGRLKGSKKRQLFFDCAFCKKGLFFYADFCSHRNGRQRHV